MKRASPFLWLGAFAILISGCCTKKDCDSFLGLSYVELSGFTVDEIDTLQVVRYAAEGTFQGPLDSMQSLTDFSDWDTVSREYEVRLELPVGSDYRLAFPGASRTYAISGIALEERTCNTCFFAIPSDRYLIVDGFVLDGAVVEGGRLELSR